MRIPHLVSSRLKPRQHSVCVHARSLRLSCLLRRPRMSRPSSCDIALFHILADSANSPCHANPFYFANRTDPRQAPRQPPFVQARRPRHPQDYTRRVCASAVKPAARIRRAVTGVVGEVSLLFGLDLPTVDPDALGSGRATASPPPVQQRAPFGQCCDHGHCD